MNTKQLVQKLVPRNLRNWLRQPRASVRYILDRIRFVFGVIPELEIRPGWRVRCHPASADHFRVFITDPVQAAELNAFIAHCKPGMRLLDVGAHYGFFALAAAYFGGPEARVVCVEASAKASSILRANLAANGMFSRVQVIEAAMGASDGKLSMLSTGPLGSDYFVVPTEPRDDTTTVNQVTLASVLKSTGFQPTHVKVDVEGYEEEVLAGAGNFLQNAQPLMFLELHGRFLVQRAIDPKKVLERLTMAGYKHFEQDGHTVGPGEMEQAGFNCRLVCRA